MSNFDFLKDFDETLWKWGNRIENEINTPSAVKADATPFLEHLLKQLRQRHGLGPSTKDFYHSLNELFQNEKISRKYMVDIYSAYMLRNQIHGDLDYIEKTEYSVALQLHKKLFYIAKKYYRDSDEYDDYRGIPSYKPPQIDLSDDEIELLEVPDFLEIVEFKYDYCVICGKPNHSNYSIYCEDCYREIENANNFISIRNNFGKNSKFRKEDLIEFGIHEAYAVRMVNSLNRSNVLNVKGNEITFNNLNIDSYMKKIDNYISVGELITKFKEDKITPSEIKETRQYKEGSFKHFPFYQFYKIINEEIINKFENRLLITENIRDSIEYATVSQKELNRWYNIQLNKYRKNDINESFLLFNNLLIDDYIDLKRQGLKEKDIESELNITKEMLEFFPKFRNDFLSEINEIKKDLLLKALSENKSRQEAIEFAGITQKEYNDIVTYSKRKENEFGQEYLKIVNQRKEQILIDLTDNDLINTCKLSNITVDDFYKWYDESAIDSEFYLKSTKILMNKFLDERRKGKTKSEASRAINLKESLVDRWLKRKNKLFDKFKDDNLKVTVDLILKGFKDKKSKKEIADDVDTSVAKINTYLLAGRKGSLFYHELFTYYEMEVIPRNLSRFLDEIRNKNLKKSLENADLTQDELDYYYLTDLEFHDKYLDFKKDKYIEEIFDGTNHDTSLSRSNLSIMEYNLLKDEIDEIILKEKMKIVKKEIRNDRTTDVAAKHAGVTVDDIYDWYYNGKTDDEFKEFSEFFYEYYMRPNILYFNKLINNGNPLDKILEKFDINFTQKDFEIWQEEGLIDKENIVINLKDDEDDEETPQSLFKSHEKLYQHEANENKLKKGYNLNSELYDSVKDDEDETFFQKKGTSQSASILKKDEKDIEKLKKEIMGKK